MPPQPFRIHVDDAVLDDLRRRLRQTRWLRPVDRDLRELVGAWLERYDWRRQESSLAQIPQFTASLGGARLHFVHRPSDRAGARALLLLHGWPDSFLRYAKVIPRLTDFHVVVPSLPGFGFTGRVRTPALRPNRHAAALLHRLMTSLGYDRYAIAGGDGGSVLAQILAIDHPDAVTGIHLTDLGWHVGTTDPASVTRPERSYLEHAKKVFLKDGAYAMVQSTKPRSLAPSLDDSPAGLAAWIADRFRAWTDGGVSTDDLLTNIMIYWVTRTIGSSIATYRADARSPSLTTAERVTVPVALALFPREPAGIPPRALAERTLHVVRWTEMPRGGHFAALEEPELYANDVAAFFAGGDDAR